MNKKGFWSWLSLTGMALTLATGLGYVHFAEVVSVDAAGKPAKPAVSAQKPGDWKELKAFHNVMSNTFHPMEEGDYKPIRARASEMAQKAKEWADSTPPKDFDKASIKETLKKLVVETKALSDKIAKNASDEEIKKDLTALHDRFHEVVGLCRAEDHE